MLYVEFINIQSSSKRPKEYGLSAPEVDGNYWLWSNIHNDQGNGRAVSRCNCFFFVSTELKVYLENIEIK